MRRYAPPLSLLTSLALAGVAARAGERAWVFDRPKAEARRWVFDAPKPPAWADVQARAAREGWPLVTGVGCDAPRSANWLSARREDWPGFTAPCVVVAASRGGRWWGRVLPSDASWGAVDAAVRDAARAAEPAEVPAFAPYVPPVYQAPMPTFPTPSFAPAFMPPASFGGFGGGFSRGGSRSC